VPSALLRPCAQPGCHELVERGRCAAHADHDDQRRGSAAERARHQCDGGDRERFFARLIALGIAPVCGARLPGAPVTDDSLCAAEGLLNGHQRHVDHIDPPAGPDGTFTHFEGAPQVLCGPRCHARKTATKDGGMGNPIRARGAA